jgi:seryl-tRNA synthetase
MLQTTFIRENKEEVIKRLAVKNFDGKEIVGEVISLDETRRNTQKLLDDTLAEANKLAKEIGRLFKTGQKEEAEKVRQRSTSLKSEAKELEQKLNQVTEELNLKLIEIPNLPHESVPAGKSEADNELVHEEGGIPSLPEHALPHWEQGFNAPLSIISSMRRLPWVISNTSHPC